MKRKAFSKKTRNEVYSMFDGRCAYCGEKIEMKDMQIDHKMSVYRDYYCTGKQEQIQKSINDISNLYPSCRRCNYYKGTGDIDMFRDKTKNILERTCVNSFQAKLAMQYGIIKLLEWDGKFFFEKFNNTVR